MKICGAGSLAFLGEVDHQHAQRFADLDRGEPDARRVVHGIQHVAGEFAQLGIDTLHRLGNLAQDRDQEE